MKPLFMIDTYCSGLPCVLLAIADSDQISIFGHCRGRTTFSRV